jgi:hypothetical protein
MKEKRCPKCKEDRPLKEFGKNKSKKDGLQSICTDCRLSDSPTHRRGDDVNTRFSASSKEERLGVKEPRSRSERQQAKEDLARKDLPTPKIVDLDKAHPVLDGIENTKLRSRASTFLGVLLEAGKHKDAMVKGDFTWNQWANMMHKYEGLRDLYILCKDLGDEYRKILRVDSAHERAVDGVEEPLYSAAGKFLGYKTNYSDRLLELLLKADDPARYRDLKEKSADGTVLNITMGFNRDELKAEQAATEIEEID